MSPTFTFAAALAVALFGGALADVSNQSSGGDVTRTAAESWIRTFAAGFNDHDPQCAAAAYAPDGSHLVSTGDFLQGRSEIEKYLGEMFAKSPIARQTIQFVSARRFGVDLILVEVDWKITGLPANRPADGRASYLLQKVDGEWLCVAGRSMVPTMPTAK